MSPAIGTDTIDLVVSAIIIAGLRGDKSEISATSKAVVAHADDMGQLLQDGIRQATVVRGSIADPVPAYQWQPVLGLMGFEISPHQLLQIERCRRTIVEFTQAMPSWESSHAKRLLDALGGAIDHGLQNWPREVQPETGRSDYRGLSGTTAQWSRTTQPANVVEITGKQA